MSSNAQGFTKVNIMNQKKNLSCQQILEQAVSHSGYLKRREKLINKLHHWTKCYVVILENFLYVYSGPNAKKATLACSLIGYNSVDHCSLPSHDWGFTLQPLVSCMPTLIFSCASKNEAKQWVHEIHRSLLKAHNKTAKVTASELLNFSDTSDEFGNESIYSDPDEKLGVQAELNQMGVSTLIDCENTGNPAAYDDNDLIDLGRIPLFETPCFQNNQTKSSEPSSNPSDSNFYKDPPSDVFSLFETPNISGNVSEDFYSENDASNKSESEDYYDKAMFYGVREEATQCLMKIDESKNGVYLVRTHDNRQVLTVRDNRLIVKYELQTNPDHTVQLIGHDQRFDTLAHLLHHYHYHSLPNRQELLLQIPYGLS